MSEASPEEAKNEKGPEEAKREKREKSRIANQQSTPTPPKEGAKVSVRGKENSYPQRRG